MGKESSDFRYNTGDTKVPWASVPAYRGEAW